MPRPAPGWPAPPPGRARPQPRRRHRDPARGEGHPGRRGLVEEHEVGVAGRPARSAPRITADRSNGPAARSRASRRAAPRSRPASGRGPCRTTRRRSREVPGAATGRVGSVPGIDQQAEVLAQVRRGDLVESAHHGHLVALGADGSAGAQTRRPGHDRLPALLVEAGAGRGHAARRAGPGRGAARAGLRQPLRRTRAPGRGAAHPGRGRAHRGRPAQHPDPADRRRRRVRLAGGRKQAGARSPRTARASTRPCWPPASPPAGRASAISIPEHPLQQAIRAEVVAHDRGRRSGARRRGRLRGAAVLVPA